MAIYVVGVIPAKAGIQRIDWVPAFAGTTSHNAIRYTFAAVPANSIRFSSAE